MSTGTTPLRGGHAERGARSAAPQDGAFARPDGIDLRARPLTPDDAPAVVALARADEAESLPEPMTELVDVQRSWRAPDADLDRRSLGLLDGEELVAYVVVGRHGRLDAVVPARLRGRGIGTALHRWAQATAAALGEREVGQTVPVGSAAEAFLLTAGARPEYDAWVLELPAGRRVEPQPLPRGYALGEGRPDEMSTVHRVIEDAFGEWPGRQPTTYAQWAADFLDGEEAAPWRCRVVRGPGSRVVGVAMIIGSDDGMLWVDELAVDATHRGRGLARALLAESFAEGRRRGFDRSGLSTDSRTGALGLYEHVGMAVVSTFRRLALPL